MKPSLFFCYTLYLGLALATTFASPTEGEELSDMQEMFVPTEQAAQEPTVEPATRNIPEAYDTSLTINTLVAQARARLGSARIPEKIDETLEGTLALAELHEILFKLEDDLIDRLDTVENADNDIISKILYERIAVIKQHIKALKKFNSSEVDLYLSPHRRRRGFSPWLMISGGALVAAGTGALIMASYDTTGHWQRPSIERLKQNADLMIKKLRNMVQGLPDVGEQTPPPQHIDTPQNENLPPNQNKSPENPLAENPVQENQPPHQDNKQNDQQLLEPITTEGKKDVLESERPTFFSNPWRWFQYNAHFSNPWGWFQYNAQTINLTPN